MIPIAGVKEDFENGYDSSLEEEEQMDAIKIPIFEDQQKHEKENYLQHY